MYRGSTPTFTFEFDIEFNGLTALSVVFSQKEEVKVEKTLEECEVKGNQITITLTEEETLKFETDGMRNLYTDVQFKFGFDDKRVISDIVQVVVKPILKDGAL